MAHSYISVSREDHQEQGAGDLVDGGGGEVYLTHGASKGPPMKVFMYLFCL